MTKEGGCRIFKANSMLKIAHGINTIKQLKNIPLEYGVEIDLRADGGRIILHHEPFAGGEDFTEYLTAYKQAFIVLNIKEAGIEERVIEIMEARGLADYFLLDVEFPYLYKATRAGFKKIAVRYSEAEPIEQALALRDRVEWVWIDTNTDLPLNKKVVEQLRGFKTCLVSPDRWGRPEDIVPYRKRMEELGFLPDAVMADLTYLKQW